MQEGDEGRVSQGDAKRARTSGFDAEQRCAGAQGESLPPSPGYQMPPYTPQQSAAAASRVAGRSFSRRLYVGSLHYSLTETDLLTAFAPFGAVQSIELPMDSVTGHHKGFAFLEFADESAASLALETMNNLMLAGRRIKVSRPQTLGGLPGAGGLKYTNGSLPAPPPCKADSVAAAAATAAAAAAATWRLVPQAWSRAPSSPGQWVPPVAGASPGCVVLLSDFQPQLSAEDVLSTVSAFGRVLICQLLPPAVLGACSLPHAIVHFASSAEGEACVRQLDGSQMAGHGVRATLLPHSISRIGLPAHSPPGAPPPPIAAQSPPLRLRTVALQNLLAPGERPDAQLAAEVREECETYGEVAEVLVVDQWRDTGGAAALVRFQEPRAAAMAVAALGGRLFGGRSVRAELIQNHDAPPPG